MLYISMYNSFHKSCRQKEEMYVFVNALLILFFFFFFSEEKTWNLCQLCSGGDH